MRRDWSLLISAIVLTVFACESQAAWWITVAARCRTVSPKYKVYAVTGCLVPPFPTCLKRGYSCTTVSRLCYKENACPFVGTNVASAYAIAGPGIFFGKGGRVGWASYGSEGGISPASLEQTVSRTQLEGDVLFDEFLQEITIDITGGHVSASIDTSYSLLDLRAWAAVDSTDTTITHDKTFWRASVQVLNGTVNYGGALAESRWRVDTFNAANLDTTIMNHAMWCGVPGGTTGFATAPGYGNNWNEALVWRHAVADTTVSTAVHLTFTFNYDTEPAYDAFRVEYQAGSSLVTLQSYDGTNSVGGVFGSPAQFDETWMVHPGEYAGVTQNEIVLYLRFVSDGAFSDEDGFFDTSGGVQADNVQVYLDGDLVSTGDFEPSGSMGGWWPEAAAPGVPWMTEFADADSTWVSISSGSFVIPFGGSADAFENTNVLILGDGGLSARPFSLVGVRDPHLSSALRQNYPNPFNPTTSIGYSVEAPTRVRLDVFDVSGRRVRTLVDESKPAGHHVAVWDGRSDAGRFLPSGVYFYRLAAGQFTGAKRMVLLK